MIVTTLVENTSISEEEYGPEHGLSLYIETGNQKLLFDVGASDLFLQNAQKLGVPVADVDALVISHGHYDHGGGLGTFLKENKRAGIFVHLQAFEKHYRLGSDEELEYIGLAAEDGQDERITLTSERHRINEQAWVFSNVVDREPRLGSNVALVMEQDGRIKRDVFAHEQNLVIEENGQVFLFTGCAHNGIANIIDHFHVLEGRMPDYVFGGFHLANRGSGAEDLAELDRLGEYLLGTKARFYTGHCTGPEPYERLRAIMGDKIGYLATGSIIRV